MNSQIATVDISNIIYIVTLSLIFLHIFYTDLKEGYIYLSDLLMGIAIVVIFNFYNSTFLTSLNGFFIGFVIGSLIFILSKIVNFKAFSIGDVYLLALIGAIITLPYFFPYLFLTQVVGFLCLLVFSIINSSFLDSAPLAPIFITAIPLFYYIQCFYPQLIENQLLVVLFKGG